MVTFPKYESYKDSGVEWLGEIPSHWDIKKLKYIIQAIETGKREQTDKQEVISIGGEHLLNGKIILKNLRYVSKKFYEKMLKGRLKQKDILIVKDGATIGKAVYVENKFEQPILINEHLYRIESNKFIYYHLISKPSQFYIWSSNNSAAQEGLNLFTIKNLSCPIPSPEEQNKIVEFLDRKTAEIDQAIAQKQRLIELLQEQKAILINQAVTKGLDPNVPMCDRGVEWIGEIPAHWDVVRSRYVFKEQNERSLDGSEIHLCMSQKLGLVPSDELKEKTLQSESYEGAKLCKKADLVLNRLKAHLGVFSVARCDGLVSPDYSVFRLQNQGMTPEYFENLFKTNQYISEFNKRVKGIVVGFYRLYTDAFNDIACLCPPKIEQVEIRNWIFMLNQEFKVVENAINTEIEKLTELKTVLISNAVTGKIKV